MTPGEHPRRRTPSEENAVPKSRRQKQTLASFDYQWGNLPEGHALLSDPKFAERVPDILSTQELCIGREWFPSRQVLDAGCGGGRWTKGLLDLGCNVTAMDYSASACASVAERFSGLPNLRIVQGDVLAPPPEVADRQYDLVFCWGVLHHTGDVRGGMMALSELVAPEGLMYLYLYGRESFSAKTRLSVALKRAILRPLPFRAKKAVLSMLVGEESAHLSFDLLSPAINERYTFDEASAWLTEAGLPVVERTIDHTELFIRARRDECSASAHFLPPPSPPYWFQEIA